MIGDILLSFEGKSVSDTADVQAMLGPESVGKTLNAQIIRGGALVEVAIALGERT